MALLDKRPDDVELKWFLNAAFMATGGYPARVPAKHLIAPDVPLRRPRTSGRFVDVSSQAGVQFVLIGRRRRRSTISTTMGASRS